MVNENHHHRKTHCNNFLQFIKIILLSTVKLGYNELYGTVNISARYNRDIIITLEVYVCSKVTILDQILQQILFVISKNSL